MAASSRSDLRSRHPLLDKRPKRPAQVALLAAGAEWHPDLTFVLTVTFNFSVQGAEMPELGGGAAIASPAAK
jgi:hypothetical protein